MKIYVAKPSARCKTMKECFSDSLVEIDLHEFWHQHEIDDKEFYLEQFIKEKIGAK